MSSNTQRANAQSTTTATTTQTAATEPETLRLTLRQRPTVRWEEGTVDNEGMGRKSSKRCCIFHKQRAFGESSTDSSDDESANRKPIAKPKPKQVPDFQRYHA